MQDSQTYNYQKGMDTVADSSTCYDKPDKRQKHPHYEHRTTKMMRKNNEFSDKKFQRVRHVSSQRKLLKSFKRIGRCLNHVSRDDMPKDGYDKVCLILMDTMEHKKHDPKIGAMNDGYLFGLYHHRLGFKVFYLYNCIQGNYPKYLQFFLHNTTDNLTVFFSGRDALDYGTHGVEFKDMTVTSNQLATIIARDNNGKCKVVFVSDCAASGSVFDISLVNKVNNPNPSDMLSFVVDKMTDPDSKQGRRSHGIFTYYFCKIIYDEPAISAKRAVERMNGFLGRFGESVTCEATNQLLMDQPMYPPPSHPADPNQADPIDEILDDDDDGSDENDDDSNGDDDGQASQ